MRNVTVKCTLLNFILCCTSISLHGMDAQQTNPNLSALQAIGKAVETDNPEYLKAYDPKDFKRYIMKALSTSSALGSVNMIEYLLSLPKDMRPNINHQNHHDGTTALISAARHNQLPAARILLANGANSNLSDKEKNTPLMSASHHNNVEMVELLLKYKAETNIPNAQDNTALIIASDNCNKKIVDLLLSAGADPNAKNIKKNTALIASSDRACIPVVKSLIKNKAKVNKKNDHNNTALMLITIRNNQEGVRLLLEAGADPNIQDRDGNSPLMIASAKGNRAIVELLLEHGASKNLENKHKKTALIFASMHAQNHLIPLLKNKKNTSQEQRIIEEDKKASQIHIIVSLLEKSKNANFINTILKKHPSILKEELLLSASFLGKNNAIQNLLRLEETPNLNYVEPTTENTSLIVASGQNKIETVKLLLSNGANPNIKNKKGKTALKVAQAKGHKEVVKLLQQATSQKKAHSKPKKKNLQKKRRKRKQPQAPRQVTPQSIPSPVVTQKQVVKEPSEEELAQQAQLDNTIKLWHMTTEGKAKQVAELLTKPFDPHFIQENNNLLMHAVKLAIKEPNTVRRLKTVESLLANKEIQQFINDPDKTGETLIQKATNKHPLLARSLAENGASKPSMTCPAMRSDENIFLDPSPEEEDDESDYESLYEGRTTQVISYSDDPLFEELIKGSRAKISTIEQILQQKPRDLTKQRSGGKTPLMHAIESRVKEKELRYILKELTPEHINLEEQTEQRDTALTKAIRNGIWPWINLLLGHGALIRDKDIETAQQLHDDEQRSHGNTEKAKKLWKNLTLLQEAKKHQDANKMLLKATQEPTENFEPIERVLEMGADINTKDEHGNTPLMYSIMTKNNVTAKGLIERKALLNLQNENGKTALILAVEANNYDLADYLLQHGADETMSDTADATAYGYATANGYTDIANRILTYRALKNLKKSGTIKHVLNRHTILGKNKKPTIIGTGQVIQNQPYMAQHKDKSTTSFFPRSWSKEKIQKAIIHVLQKPEQLHEQPAQITEDNQVLRNALILRGSYEGIPIKVIISQTNDKHEPWKVFTAYPIIKQP